MQPDYPQFGGAPQQPVAASQMKSHRRSFLVPFIVALVLLLISIGFGIWAFVSRQDYKNNVDQKIAEASELVKAETEAAKEVEFAEREKEPLKDYKGPDAFGGVVIKYPKTWSAYVSENDSSTPVDGYFHPDFVPGIDSGTQYALHVEVLEEDYSDVLEDYESASEKGEVRVTAVKPANVDGVTGARIDGAIDKDIRGSVVLFPLRDKTLKLTTESEQYVKDFNNIILKNLSFTP